MSYVTHSTTLFVQPTKLTCSSTPYMLLRLSLFLWKKTQQWFVKKNLHPRLTFLLIHPPLLNPASVNSTMHSCRFNHHHHSLHFHSCFFFIFFIKWIFFELLLFIITDSNQNMARRSFADKIGWSTRYIRITCWWRIAVTIFFFYTFYRHICLCLFCIINFIHWCLGFKYQK